LKLNKQDEKSTINIKGKYCSEIQDQPINISVENMFAFDVVELTHKISPTQTNEFIDDKNNKIYKTRIPTLQMLETAIYFLHPEPMTQDYLLDLINRVTIIHNMKVSKWQ